MSVITTGTVMGAVMAVVLGQMSGQILQTPCAGNLTSVLVVDGLLALFGVAVATWVEVTLKPTR